MQRLSPCPVCGSSNAQLRYPATLRPGEDWHAGFDPYGGHYQINRCKGCGLVFSSPVFDSNRIAALYLEYPAANAGQGEIGNVRATMAGYYRMARSYLGKRDRVLDVGCDIGLLLDVAREDGFRELHGIEPIAVAREAATAQLPGAHIHPEFYQECRFPDNHFNLITFVHVVDHLLHPVELLNRAYRHLAPGGIVVAVVHDIEAPLARLMGERYPVYNFFHHYFFSKATLTELFERCGFETLRVGPTRNRYSLAFLMERFPLLPQTFAGRMSRWSRTLGIGRLSLSLPIGNIGIVARKPTL